MTFLGLCIRSKINLSKSILSFLTSVPSSLDAKTLDAVIALGKELVLND